MFNFGPSLPVLQYFGYASSKGSGQAVNAQLFVASPLANAISIKTSLFAHMLHRENAQQEKCKALYIVFKYPQGTPRMGVFWGSKVVKTSACSVSNQKP